MEEIPKRKEFTRNIGKPSVSFIDWENMYSPEGVRRYYRFFEIALTKQGIDPKKVKVLEIGSGNALFVDYTRNQGVNIVGVDVDPRGSKESPQVIARIEELPFPNESFDVIWSSSVFDSDVYRDQDTESMIKEIIRVLKPGGVYIFMEPNEGEIPMPPGMSKVGESPPVFKKL